MKSVRYISAIFSLVGISAFAQDINKEITIEKEIVPEQRAATRLPVTHLVLSTATQAPSLEYNLVDRGVGIVPRFSALAPSATAAAIEPSPYRGYAAIGYFQIYNLGATVGYNLINSSTTNLGASAEFIGYNYKSGYYNQLMKEQKIGCNDVTANVALLHYFDRNQQLTMNAGFGFGAVDAPMPLWYQDIDNKSLRANLDARWRAGSATQSYTVGVHGGLFNYLNNYSERLELNCRESMKEVTFGGDFGMIYGPYSIDVDASFRRNGDFNTPIVPVGQKYYMIEHISDSKFISIVSATPAFTFDNNDGLRVRAGVKVQYVGGSYGKIRVAPDVTCTYIPFPLLAVQADVTGGEVMNSLADMYQISPFTSSHVAYLTSNIPFDANVRVVAGPYHGASAELFGGYSMVRHWLMPYYNGKMYAPVNMDGWHVGVKVSYSLGTWLDVWASGEFAPNSFKHGYYMWRDHAKAVAKANLSVNPISKLKLSVGYEFRSGRRIWGFGALSSYNTQGDQLLVNQKTFNNLSAEIAYQYRPSVTFFARGQNLMRHQTTLYNDIPAQGITGLVGVEVKF